MDYFWQVASVCDSSGSIISNWASNRYFTAKCTTPDTFWVQDLTAYTARIGWAKVFGAMGYTIHTTRIGSPPRITYTVWGANNTHKYFVNLIPQSQYVWRVRAFCDTTRFSVSSFTEIDTLTTSAPSSSRISNPLSNPTITQTNWLAILPTHHPSA